MITQKINGGLGNQMFQYAFIKALSLKNKIDFKLDISGFNNYFRPFELEVFNIEKKYIQKNQIPFYQKIYSKNEYLNFLLNKIKLFLKICDRNYYKEKQFNFDLDFLHIKSGYIEGYFQSEKYFKNYKKQIKKDFTFKIKPSKKNKEIIKIIKSYNSISLHIRRGDYVNNKLHFICNTDYYKKAINLIKRKIKNPVFFFFSDDIKWVKNNLKVKENGYYIDWNIGKDSYEDMRLMSLCKHNIIANSSFSWWGAWLNKNKNKIVISPKKWFNSRKINYSDIIPNNWIKI